MRRAERALHPDAPQEVCTRVKFWVDDHATRYSFIIDREKLFGDIEIWARLPKYFIGKIEFSDFGFITLTRDNKPGVIVPSEDGQDQELELDVTPHWRFQDGVLKISCMGETIRFFMPERWSLAHVNERRRTVIEDFLFGRIKQNLFGTERLINKKNLPDYPPSSKDTILSFSTGEDSTAALCCLPSLTSKYFAKRSFKEYRTCSGKTVRLADTYPEEHALSLVPDCIVVETDMELYKTRFGEKMGNPATLAVITIGILLADYCNVGSISIGAQLETSYLQGGQIYEDVYACEDSVFWKYVNLLGYAGLEISYPVACLSEVLTSFVVRQYSDRYYSVPCPHTNHRLEGCGRCYKCFRKKQLNHELVNPDNKTRAILTKRPLKMASSAIYAVQRSEQKWPELSEYENVDLQFLERYYERALETLVPRDLRDHIKAVLCKLGLEPMNDQDEAKLRAIGRILAPENHSDERAFPKGVRSKGASG